MGSCGSKHDVRNTGRSKFRPMFMKRIQVKMSEDNESCYIKSIIPLSCGKVVISDIHNGVLKLVDVREEKVVSCLETDGMPFAIAKITDDLVAITYPDTGIIKNVKIVDDNLLHLEDFHVNGDCHGIAYYDNRLFVSYDNPPKIEVLTTKATLLRTIHCTKKVRLIRPWPMVVNENGIYFPDQTNFGFTVVRRLSHDGRPLDTFGSLFNLSGLAVGRINNILVVDLGWKNIKVLTYDLHCVNTLNYGKLPYAIGYDLEKHIMYTAYFDDDTADENYLAMYAVPD